MKDYAGVSIDYTLLEPPTDRPLSRLEVLSYARWHLLGGLEKILSAEQLREVQAEIEWPLQRLIPGYNPGMAFDTRPPTVVETLTDWAKRRDDLTPRQRAAVMELRAAFDEETDGDCMVSASTVKIRKAAIQGLLGEGHDPPSTISWEKFQEKVAKAAGVSLKPRGYGYGLRTIKKHTNEIRGSGKTGNS